MAGGGGRKSKLGSIPGARWPRMTAFENFEYPWEAETSLVLLLCLLNVFSSCLGSNNYLRLPPQLQGPDKVIEYLKGKCCGYSREAQFIARSWALASIYQTLLNIVQHTPVADTVADTEAIPYPATDTAATPTAVIDTAATSNPSVRHCSHSNPSGRQGGYSNPMAGTAAETEIQPMPVSVAPIQKNYTKKSVCLVRVVDEPGPS
ncbi:ubiquitin carboxyl-terminal hydrolase 4 [Limosa lapponica baueri]|uniref:Ubiquitin carboxyl-terminal hydrolase 4 n=1 Tax=Limosa lapponica baueri TaxID=1758121 RepID=A0A2I0TC02_LIMLA|nr:ubiquitin carboxyl-terminal hydrolase 4 [Limosa lapponica baueri]